MEFEEGSKGNCKLSAYWWSSAAFWTEWNIMLVLSSSFLGVMMLVAIVVRIKVKDNISDILPAFAYLVLSGIILYEATAH